MEPRRDRLSAAEVGAGEMFETMLPGKVSEDHRLPAGRREIADHDSCESIDDGHNNVPFPPNCTFR